MPSTFEPSESSPPSILSESKSLPMDTHAARIILFNYIRTLGENVEKGITSIRLDPAIQTLCDAPSGDVLFNYYQQVAHILFLSSDADKSPACPKISSLSHRFTYKKRITKGSGGASKGEIIAIHVASAARHLNSIHKAHPEIKASILNILEDRVILVHFIFTALFDKFSSPIESTLIQWTENLALPSAYGDADFFAMVREQFNKPKMDDFIRSKNPFMYSFAPIFKLDLNTMDTLWEGIQELSIPKYTHCLRHWINFAHMERIMDWKINLATPSQIALFHHQGAEHKSLPSCFLYAPSEDKAELDTLLLKLQQAESYMSAIIANYSYKTDTDSELKSHPFWRTDYLVIALQFVLLMKNRTSDLSPQVINNLLAYAKLWIESYDVDPLTPIVDPELRLQILQGVTQLLLGLEPETNTFTNTNIDYCLFLLWKMKQYELAIELLFKSLALLNGPEVASVLRDNLKVYSSLTRICIEDSVEPSEHKRLAQCFEQNKDITKPIPNIQDDYLAGFLKENYPLFLKRLGEHLERSAKEIKSFHGDAHKKDKFKIAYTQFQTNIRQLARTFHPASEVLDSISSIFPDNPSGNPSAFKNILKAKKSKPVQFFEPEKKEEIVHALPEIIQEPVLVSAIEPVIPTPETLPIPVASVVEDRPKKNKKPKKNSRRSSQAPASSKEIITESQPLLEVEAAEELPTPVKELAWTQEAVEKLMQDLNDWHSKGNTAAVQPVPSASNSVALSSPLQVAAQLPPPESSDVVEARQISFFRPRVEAPVFESKSGAGPQVPKSAIPSDIIDFFKILKAEISISDIFMVGPAVAQLAQAFTSWLPRYDFCVYGLESIDALLTNIQQLAQTKQLERFAELADLKPCEHYAAFNKPGKFKYLKNLEIITGSESSIQFELYNFKAKTTPFKITISRGILQENERPEMAMVRKSKSAAYEATSIFMKISDEVVLTVVGSLDNLYNKIFSMQHCDIFYRNPPEFFNFIELLLGCKFQAIPTQLKNAFGENFIRILSTFLNDKEHKEQNSNQFSKAFQQLLQKLPLKDILDMILFVVVRAELISPAFHDLLLATLPNLYIYQEHSPYQKMLVVLTFCYTFHCLNALTNFPHNVLKQINGFPLKNLIRFCVKEEDKSQFNYIANTISMTGGNVLIDSIYFKSIVKHICECYSVFENRSLTSCSSP